MMLLWSVGSGLISLQVDGKVSDIRVINVTPSALSVVWFSDEAIATSDIRVFNDVNALDEVTGDLVVNSDSEAVAGAHEIGLAKVTVAGLQPGQSVFLQTVTASASGSIQHPQAGMLIRATTTASVRRVTASAHLITNDIVEVPVADPTDPTRPLAGGLSILELIDTAGAPISRPVGALNGEGGGNSTFINLNNVFAAVDGSTLPVPDEAIVRITQRRGLACADVENGLQISFGRVRAHEEAPRITELERLRDCFISDRVCDNAVNIQDVQFVLNSFGEARASCEFNKYLDVSPDDEINILDVQAVLNNFGETAPF